MIITTFSQANVLRNIIFNLIIDLKKKTNKNGKSIRKCSEIAEINPN